jgi:uncharacterized protein YaaQ
MKLLVAVIQPKDADACVAALNRAGFLCTRLASYGGFLDRDNVTLLIGVDAAQVEEVIDILRARAKRRTEVLPGATREQAAGPASPSLDVEVGGATVFLVDVERYEKL